MTPITWTYLAYFVAGVSVTCWVAKTQRQYGVAFARRGDRYDAETGPAMCHLLIVGFCLVCFGIVSIALGLGSKGLTLESCIEALSSKLGWSILLIGAIHFLMLSAFAAMGKRQDPDHPATPAHSVSGLLHRTGTQPTGG